MTGLVLGVDPGTATTGYGLACEEQGRLKCIAYGVIQTPAGAAVHVRLQILYSELSAVVAKYQPVSGAVEKLFFHRNAAAALAVRVQQGGDPLALARVHLRLGALYHDHLSDQTRAAAHLQTALAADPGSTEALERLATIHTTSRNWTGAADCLRRLLELDGTQSARARHTLMLARIADEGFGDVGQAIALFSERAPEVELHVHVAPINAIERGVIDGQFQVGVIPGHRRSASLTYDVLFDETMYLYCGASHAFFRTPVIDLGWEGLAQQQFAGLGYHSPNMDLSQQMHLPRKATGFDQEAIAHLILSGKFLGFLPDHYAAGFEQQGLMRALNPAVLRYACSFLGILRRSPEPSRAARVFQACLVEAHNGLAPPGHVPV